MAETSLAILNQLQDTSLTVTAVLMDQTIPLKKLYDMTPGNIIMFDLPVNTPTTLCIHNNPIAQGTPIQSGEKYAIQITQLISKPS